MGSHMGGHRVTKKSKSSAHLWHPSHTEEGTGRPGCKAQALTLALSLPCHLMGMQCSLSFPLGMRV